MSPVVSLHEITRKDVARVGGKACALAALARNGITIPDGVCVCVDAYQAYVRSAGLRERIMLELNRKNFTDMRWEEMWDASLRIRSMFLNTPIPKDIKAHIHTVIATRFGSKPVVVRSSAPGEDASKTSFAGLHESYVNVRGADSILEHIRLVWASLWSDAALLYRQELGLSVESSTMAVVIQEMVAGDRSGVAFGRNPNDQSQAVIEAVYGLNQALVDGTVEPDRWILERSTGEIISHTPVRRDQEMVPSTDGVRLKPLPAQKSTTPPLDTVELKGVFGLVLQTEKLFGSPQDVEWTFVGRQLYALQARPITTNLTRDAEDKRRWNLSLRRSFDNLKALRKKIEENLLPDMAQEARRLAGKDLTQLSDAALQKEIKRRSQIHQKWVDVYWKEFIPFAHGARLFGQVYNDTVRPSDPYEFTDLLRGTDMKSLERNRMLEKMAQLLRDSPSMVQALKEGRDRIDADFDRMLDGVLHELGDQSWGSARLSQERSGIIRLLIEMASHPPAELKVEPKNVETLTREFLSHFQGGDKEYATELLDLARVSYRLRDDDNIYLGRIESQKLAAMTEAQRRSRKSHSGKTDHAARHETIDEFTTLERPMAAEAPGKAFRIEPRQLKGQPAGPGIAVGTARIILNAPDLFSFKAGEVLVCDAVDPNMTFIVPLAAAIVERRGGMLIHGAIIAREYGLPCVTGVPDAARLIKTGDRLTVDGYLGIVTVSR